jgi:hypothetical protein
MLGYNVPSAKVALYTNLSEKTIRSIYTRFRSTGNAAIVREVPKQDGILPKLGEEEFEVSLCRL